MKTVLSASSRRRLPAARRQPHSPTCCSPLPRITSIWTPGTCSTSSTKHANTWTSSDGPMPDWRCRAWSAVYATRSARRNRTRGETRSTSSRSCQRTWIAWHTCLQAARGSVTNLTPWSHPSSKTIRAPERLRSVLPWSARGRVAGWPVSHEQRVCRLGRSPQHVDVLPGPRSSAYSRTVS